MARSRDLRRGFALNPLGIPIPVHPAPGQPMPGINRTRPLEDIEAEHLQLEAVRQAAKPPYKAKLTTDKILNAAARNACFKG